MRAYHQLVWKFQWELSDKWYCSDFVTDSYGDSWDSSWQISWVPGQNQWIPVWKKIKTSPKLKILEPLWNQTVKNKVFFFKAEQRLNDRSLYPMGRMKHIQTTIFIHPIAISQFLMAATNYFASGFLCVRAAWRRYNEITGTSNFIAPKTGMWLSLTIYKNWYIFHFFSRALWTMWILILFQTAVCSKGAYC